MCISVSLSTREDVSVSMSRMRRGTDCNNKISDDYSCLRLMCTLRSDWNSLRRWLNLLPPKKHNRITSSYLVQLRTAHPLSLQHPYNHQHNHRPNLLRTSSVKTISAAARAASVAPATAMPTSALLRAGASLTPSPVIPVLKPNSRNV